MTEAKSQIAPAGLEPWQWPEEVWRRIVNRARAGRSLKPAAWPGGAQCAVALSFDADHETNPLREGDESPMRISQGQYGARQGIAAHPCPAGARAVPGHLLLPGGLRAAAPGRGARGGGGRPRDRHPFLDPRAQHHAAPSRPSAT